MRGLWMELERIETERRFLPYLGIVDSLAKHAPRWGVTFSRSEISNAKLFFLWLKCVDDEIDCRHADGAAFLDAVVCGEGDPHTVAMRLSLQLHALGNPEFYRAVGRLYQANEEERQAANMADFIDARRRVGWCCADASTYLVNPRLFATASGMVQFYREGMGILNVLDAALDQRRDSYRFQPSLPDRARLSLLGLLEPWYLLTRAPFMLFDFARGLRDMLERGAPDPRTHFLRSSRNPRVSEMPGRRGCTDRRSAEPVRRDTGGTLGGHADAG